VEGHRLTFGCSKPTLGKIKPPNSLTRNSFGTARLGGFTYLKERYHVLVAHLLGIFGYNAVTNSSICTPVGNRAL
jgi:hypothetical protein